MTEDSMAWRRMNEQVRIFEEAKLRWEDMQRKDCQTLVVDPLLTSRLRAANSGARATRRRLTPQHRQGGKPVSC